MAKTKKNKLIKSIDNVGKSLKELEEGKIDKDEFEDVVAEEVMKGDVEDTTILIDKINQMIMDYYKTKVEEIKRYFDSQNRQN